MFGTLQYLILVVMAFVVFAIQAFAFIDAARRPAQAFKAEGKLSKPIWLAILGAAAVIGLLGLPPGMYTSRGLLNIIAVVAAVVYLADVRPRIKPYRSGGQQGSAGGW